MSKEKRDPSARRLRMTRKKERSFAPLRMTEKAPQDDRKNLQDDKEKKRGPSLVRDDKRDPSLRSG